MEKGVSTVISIVSLITVTFAFLLLTGCLEVCPKDHIKWDTRGCCPDLNKNLLCDDSEASPCGNGTCDVDENCTTCWKDCGACKRIVYVYVPANYSIAELKDTISKSINETVKVKKDIESDDNVSDFYYYNIPLNRYIADFMGKKYVVRTDARSVLISKITNPNYYVNDSESLLRFTNYSKWYLLSALLSGEQENYEWRIMTNRAREDYPTPPTGYDKEYKYSEWQYRNFTRNETTIFENVTVLGKYVEAVSATIVDYRIKYRYNVYEDDSVIREALKDVDERYMRYAHTISIPCSRNSIVTIYNYEYDLDYKISAERLTEQVAANRNTLLMRAERISEDCKQFSKMVLVS